MIARSIIEMVDAHPSLFYKQDWYREEPFAHLKLTPLIGLPTHLMRCTIPVAPELVDHLTDACLLVDLYVRFPHDAMWRYEVPCAGRTQKGQEIWIGNTANKGVLEIHRKVTPEHPSLPLWR